MYLSDIEIVGFKSFAQKIKLKFNGGLSAIVGPNGCGKTNVVDAIRWVLGEKKASTLRSDVMENVIFNGTKDRKPLSMAEVTITFDNNKQILPTDYTEVAITRRLFRNGDSEYFINKTPCRLKDINDLFMDTGIGPDSYSVIELKMIDAILSGNVDDRRSMFEEAAGIKKYKQRRKETFKKLENVQTDTERLNDIIQEVRKNVNSLSRQASKTKRYNQYLSRLKELDLCLLKTDMSRMLDKRDSLESQLNEKITERQKFEVALQESELSLKELKEKLNHLDNKYTKANNTSSELAANIASAQKTTAVNEEKLNSLNETEKRLKDEIRETENAIKKLNNDIEQIAELRKSLEEEKIAFAQKRSEAENTKQDIRNEHRALQNEVNALQNEYNNLSSRSESLRKLLERNESRKSMLEQKLDNNSTELFSYNTQLDELHAELTTAESKTDELRDAINDKRQLLEDAKARKAQLDNQITDIKRQINDLHNLAGSRKSSVEFLNSLVDGKDVTKFLNTSKDWSFAGDKVLLGEIVGCDEDIRIAVSAALAEAAHYFIVDNETFADEAIELLKKNNKGKTGFICREQIPAQPKPPKSEKSNDIIGTLSEIVRVDDKIRDFLRLTFSDTLIVTNQQTAKQLTASGKALRAVSLDGTVYEANGTIKGGSYSQKEGLWVGKKEKLKSLNEEIAKINSQIQDLNTKIEQLTAQAQSIVISKAESDRDIAEKALKENENSIQRLLLQKESIKRNIANTLDNSTRYSDEIAEITEESANSSDELAEIANKSDSLLASLKEKRTVLAQLSAKADESERQLKDIEFKLIRKDADIKTADTDIERIKANITEQQNRKISRENQLRELAEQRRLLTEQSIELSQTLATNENELELTNEKLRTLSHERRIIAEQYDQYFAEFELQRKNYDKLKDAIHHSEIELTEINSQMNNMLEKARDQYETEIADINIEIPEDFDHAAARTETYDLRQKLNELGSINFMALEEFETQSERLDFYEKQLNDLLESEKILKETIEEINRTAEQNFRDTFDKVRANFQMLFKKLFGDEGDADIGLESGDVLEADITITAKPPNKRPQSIKMLSGGEKTLTAIALLFSIYLVKPSPFCILDEVDAPLDDANIEKFIALIKDFRHETQFLIVTHNKKTMEAAETLYGITMQEDGVSKVVSVKLSAGAA